MKNQLASLDPKKATGIDGISAKFLKLSSHVLARPLTKILNLSIITGIFPEMLKKAKVNPIFKRGDKSDKANYRPISILPVLSKILKRHICDHLKVYLNTFGLIYERQSGFREYHSCETALTAIVDDWITAIDNNEIVGTIFLDLSKAFDLVNHEILLIKLKYYQVSNNTISWFSSYLSERSQQVSISGKLSSPRHISSGVPQGSVLGPLLFMLYINDLSLEIQKSVLDMFADDATLTFSGTSVENIIVNLNCDLQEATKWCDNNNMVINTDKTKAMFISTSHKHPTIQNSTHDLRVGTASVQNSHTERLLGVTLDSTLSWITQVDKTIKKCNSLLFLLGRIKYFLNIPSRQLFFNAYILPHIDYCCTIWGNCNTDLQNRLLKFQKRAARLILDQDMTTSSQVLFQQLGWLRFDERVEYRKAILMYKSLNNLAPAYLTNKFTYTHNIHELNLRSATNNTLYMPKPNLEIYRRSLSYSGSRIRNSLPESVRSAQNVDAFKLLYLR